MKMPDRPREHPTNTRRIVRSAIVRPQSASNQMRTNWGGPSRFVDRRLHRRRLTYRATRFDLRARLDRARSVRFARAARFNTSPVAHTSSSSSNEEPQVPGPAPGETPFRPPGPQESASRAVARRSRSPPARRPGPPRQSTGETSSVPSSNGGEMMDNSVMDQARNAEVSSLLAISSQLSPINKMTLDDRYQVAEKINAVIDENALAKSLIYKTLLITAKYVDSDPGPKPVDNSRPLKKAVTAWVHKDAELLLLNEALQRKHVTKDKEMTEMQQEIELLRQENNNLRKHVQTLKDDNALLARQLRELKPDKEVKRLKEDRERMRLKVAKTNTFLEQTRRDCIQAQRDVMKFGRENEDLKRRKQRLEDKCKDAEEIIAKLDDDRETMAKQITALRVTSFEGEMAKTGLREAQAFNNSLLEANNALSNYFDKAMNELNDQLNVAKQELGVEGRKTAEERGRVSSLKNILSRTQAELGFLKGKHEEEVKAKIELNKTLDLQVGMLEEKAACIAELQKIIENLEEKIWGLQQTNDHLKTKCDIMDDIIREFEEIMPEQLLKALSCSPNGEEGGDHQQLNGANELVPAEMEVGNRERPVSSTNSDWDGEPSAILREPWNIIKTATPTLLTLKSSGSNGGETAVVADVEMMDTLPEVGVKKEDSFEGDCETELDHSGVIF